MAQCAKCGTMNRPGVSFCSRCGGAFGGVAPVPAVAAAPAPIPATAAAPRGAAARLLPYVLKRLPLMALSFFGSWFVHTYLVFLNDGWDKGKISGLTPFINVLENDPMSAMMLWGACSALGWSFIATMFSQGPVRAVTSIVMQPVNMVKQIAGSTRREGACWALGAGVALLGSAALNTNRPAGLSFALLGSMFGLSDTGRMIAQQLVSFLTKLGTGMAGTSVKYVQIVMAALAPGFAVAGALNMQSVNALLGILAIAGGVFLLLRHDDKGKGLAAGQIQGLLLIASGGAALYSLWQLLWPRIAHAGDFGDSENHGDFVGALNGEGGKKAIQLGFPPSAAAGLGPLAPAIKPPKKYDDGPNVWDPPPDEQTNRWNKDHVVWDPNTLSWRPPHVDEFPPPPVGPEGPPPYEKQHPADQIPDSCRDLYNQYVQAQATAKSGDDAIQAAGVEYQSAVDAMLKMYAKLVALLGFEGGQAMAPYAEQGAMGAGRSALGTGESSVRAATRSGLSEIADRAASEADAAATEVSTQTTLLTQLRQASLDATTDATAAAQSLSALKTGMTGTTEAEGDVEAAAANVEASERAITEAEEEIVVARNRLQTVKNNVALGQEWTVLDSELKQADADFEQANGDLYRTDQQIEAAGKRELKARIDEKVGKALEDQFKFQEKVDQLQAQRRVIQKKAGKTLKPGDLFWDDYQAVDQEFRGAKIQQQDLALKKNPSSGFRDAMEEEAKAEMASGAGKSAELQNLEQQRQIKQKIRDEKYKVQVQKDAARDKVARQIDPAYDDPGFLDRANQDLEEKQKAAETAREARDTAKESLRTAKGKLADAQQQTADLQKQIADKELQVQKSNEKVNSLAQQESEASKKLDDLKRAAEQKRDEAKRLGQAALDSASPAPDAGGPGIGGPGIIPPPGSRPRGPADRTYDPWHDSAQNWKPDWAYWVEEKLGQAGGVVQGAVGGPESGEEMAQALTTAKQRVATAREKLQRLQNEHSNAFDTMNRVKPQLDACIQANTVWKGDDGSS